MGSVSSQPVNPYGQPQPPKQRILLYVMGFVAVGFLYLLYRTLSGAPSSILGAAVSPDLTPTSVDGKTLTVIPAASAPLIQGSDYGIQFWMYIADWDYKFGNQKNVLQRIGLTSPTPVVSLHPTDNSLQIQIGVYGNGQSSAATPAPSNVTDATGDSFTTTVENVPLQSWFAVSITVFQRNVDVYINGKLVKSSILPGVPRVAVGDIQIGADGGWSGAMCNLHAYSTALVPSDALAFFNTGTTCGSTTPVANSSTWNLFGYTFTYGVQDDSTGKEITGVKLQSPIAWREQFRLTGF